VQEFRRDVSAAWMPSVTKWNVVPHSIVMGARAWCVSYFNDSRARDGFMNPGGD
jgi:hypothetical protein